MWMILLMLVGFFFLFFPLLGLFFPFLFILLPLFFMFSRPSIKVYTRTFTPNDFNSNRSTSRSTEESTKSLPNVIDVDYTERDI